MMSRPPNRPPGPHRPLVDAYLADLEDALSGSDPAERQEVVASVQEHIEMGLSEHDDEPTGDEVEALLRQLGSVDQIAREVGDGSDRPGEGAGSVGAHQGWVPLSLALVAVVMFWFPLTSVPLAVGAGIAAAINLRGARNPAKRRYRSAIALSAIPVVVWLSIVVVRAS